MCVHINTRLCSASTWFLRAETCRCKLLKRKTINLSDCILLHHLILLEHFLLIISTTPSPKSDIAGGIQDGGMGALRGTEGR